MSDSIRAIAAYSGGLDSILAALVVQRAGIDVTLLHVHHLFSGSEQGRKRLADSADRMGLPLIVIDASDEHLDTVRHPKHGYGQGMNPCIDCRIFMLKVAKRVMEEREAQFVVTGEVLGQRPKSQHRRALLQAAEESGLGDRLLRPLCANLLPETLPVKEGWIRKADLFSIHGRSRQQQMELAKEFGVDDYPQPAGGCILIEKAYAARVRDAFDHVGRDTVDLDGFRLLMLGRHFRLSEDTKLIVGRNQEENERLAAYAHGRLRIDPADAMGPTALIEGSPSDQELRLACGLVARYSDHEDRGTIPMTVLSESGERTIEAAPLDPADPRIARLRITE